MFWINISVPSLKRPEFIGSEPSARAAWLCLLAYCADQENGGLIVGCRAWKDRQWQQTCGVTLLEVDNAEPLLMWEGDDLRIWNYPCDKEKEVQERREVARENGKRGGRPKKPTSEPTSVISENQHWNQRGGQRPKAEEEGEEEGNRNGRKKKSTHPKSPPAPTHAIAWSRAEGWQGISPEDMKEWSLAYPACDLNRQLASMTAWLHANPIKAVKKNWRRFITNWLTKAQDKGGDSLFHGNGQHDLKAKRPQLQPGSEW